MHVRGGGRRVARGPKGIQHRGNIDNIIFKNEKEYNQDQTFGVEKFINYLNLIIMIYLVKNIAELRKFLLLHLFICQQREASHMN